MSEQQTGTTVDLWTLDGSQVYITYDWVRQESCIYVNGELRFTIPLQPIPKEQHVSE